MHVYGVHVIEMEVFDQIIIRDKSYNILERAKNFIPNNNNSKDYQKIIVNLIYPFMFIAEIFFQNFKFTTILYLFC